MKEKLCMQKVKYKRGITLVELMIGSFIFSVLVIGIYFFGAFYQINNLKKARAINNTIVINECYELFTNSPIDFRECIVKYYGSEWDNNDYYFEMNQELSLKIIEDNKGIKIEVYEKGKLTET